ILAYFFIGTLFAGSVRIMNDSPYPLSAEILAADGTSQGRLALNPQQQLTWQSTSSGNSVLSQTPYTVIFTCKTGKQFGVITGVQQGATVNALSASGDRYCEPVKDQSQDNHSSKKSAPSQAWEDTRWSPGSADSQSSSNDSDWGPP